MSVDKAAIRQLLERIADTLDRAPAETQEAANAYVKRVRDAGQYVDGPYAHRSGGLEEVCRQSATSLRIVLAVYLKPTKGGGPRLKR